MAGPTRRPSDPLAAAEKLFKSVPKGPAPAARPVSPEARETVSIRIDRDVLDHFQADGPGWQERINAALRQAAGLTGKGAPGKRPDELDATNDD
jgi:uncharacterized protein (DUF4415 family)